MESKGNSTVSSDQKTNEKTFAASAIAAKPNGKSDVPSDIPKKQKYYVALSSAHGDRSMFFIDVSFGPHEVELRFRLIHFWEARNPNTKELIGQEMLLIDEEGTVIQGFITAGQVGMYKLTSGSVYKLSNFFGSRSKVQFRVADHRATISFSWNSDLKVLENHPVPILEDRFKFHSYEEFQANCDRIVDLYDYVGHMKLVNGQTITDHTALDEVDIAEKRHLCVHVQTHDGPVMKLHLWDNAASEFCQKFISYGRTPTVLLVTTVNPKYLGGTLALASMASSRVFMDTDVQPTKDYLAWLSSNLDIANKITAEVVTKREPVTLEELYSYIKQETANVAWFECTTTIDDIVQSSSWYYISCGGCNSNTIKGSTSLICNNKKCVKREVTGVPQYLTKIAVYDKSEQAVFAILGDAGKELTGKHASELVAKYFESNEGLGAKHLVPVLQALLDTIGHTHKFIVKVSDHNLTGKTQTITVTKILPPEAPLAIAHLEEGTTPAVSDDVLKGVGDEPGPSTSFEHSAGDRVRKSSESLESLEAKRSKSG
uniref:Replication factor A C-terminal domain-containing protein n=1 Tax=Brassica oleracea TaxID=3712 RepID=A0A3P6GUT0_BRAOL|nr:unnamed protein product [Brassica oleracea]